MPVGCVGPGLDMVATRKLRWAPPHGEARHLTALSIASGAWTTVVFDDFDLDGNLGMVNDGYLLGAWPGWWTLNLNFVWSPNVTGLRGIQICRNGNSALAIVQHTVHPEASGVDMNCSVDFYVPAGTDYYNAQAIQFSGAPLAAYTPAIVNGWDTPLFTATYLGGPPP